MEIEENIPNDKKSRSRGENWTQNEKELLLEIMQQSAAIIENKQTDTNTNKRKHLEWVNIQNKLQEFTGKPREISQLKGFWRRTKFAAKKSVWQHRRSLQATGAGQRPPTPPVDDLKILEMCQTDSITEDNEYDSEDEGMPGEDDDPLDGNNVNNSTTYNTDEIDTKMCGHSEIKIGFLKVPKLEFNDTTRSDKPNKIDYTKGANTETNIQLKKRVTMMMAEEHKLKIKFQKRELVHQKLQQQLEIEILMIEKEKKMLELEILKKKLM